MKTQNIILLLLCTMLLGFFANFAQNGYGISIVGISIILLAFVIQISAISTLPKNKIISIPTFLGLPLFLVLAFLFENNIPDDLIMPIILFWFLYPFVSPLILKRIHFKKTGEKINFFQYFELVFFALFCFGFAFKIQHWPLSSVLLVVSLFVIIPYLIHLIKTFKNSSDGTIIKIQYSFYHVFILAIIYGAIFSIQHYVRAKALLLLPSMLLGLFLLSLIHPAFRKNFSLSIQKLRWFTSVVLVSFIVLTLHFWARRFDLVPKLYSNEYPQVYEELLANSNELTKEGIENKKKANLYYEEYSAFIDELEKENQQEQ
jgi:hypothetical protein